jgi:hypothetical protein
MCNSKQPERRNHHHGSGSSAYYVNQGANFHHQSLASETLVPNSLSVQAAHHIHNMPTPESAAFLAKKPTVPPTFDGVDYDDSRRLKQAQDAIVREQWVKVMMGRLVREELSKCYYREGINHLEKCGHLRG